MLELDSLRFTKLGGRHVRILHRVFKGSGCSHEGHALSRSGHRAARSSREEVTASCSFMTRPRVAGLSGNPVRCAFLSWMCVSFSRFFFHMEVHLIKVTPHPPQNMHTWNFMGSPSAYTSAGVRSSVLLKMGGTCGVGG